jgi:hypothetical protein
MIKCWLIEYTRKIRGASIIETEVTPDYQRASVAEKKTEGVFLTLTELEALARESFEAGVALVTWGIVTANCGEKRPPNFESFWAEFKKKMGE